MGTGAFRPDIVGRTPPSALDPLVQLLLRPVQAEEGSAAGAPHEIVARCEDLRA